MRIWELPGLSPSSPYFPKTDCFPDFWENNLLVTPTSSNHPRLSWAGYPGTVIGYKIYRKYGTQFVPLASVSSSTFEYVDNDLTINNIVSGGTVEYYVRGIFSANSESIASNTVSVNVSGQSPEKKELLLTHQIHIHLPLKIFPPTLSTPKQS